MKIDIDKYSIEKLKGNTDFDAVDSFRFLNCQNFIELIGNSDHKDFLKSFKKITSTSFYDTSLTQEFSCLLVDFIESNENLVGLTFHRLKANEIHASSLFFITYRFKHKLKSLDFSLETLNPKAITQLLNSITPLDSLENLNLNFEDQQTKYQHFNQLVQIVKNNKKFKELKLGFNNVSLPELSMIYGSLNDSKIENLSIKYKKLDTSQSL
jgi:hypothetical protein